MSVTNKLKDPWEVLETVAFSGTVTLPTGADPTDYTAVFKIKRDGVLLDTMSAVLDASSNYVISHTLGALVTCGDVQVYVYLTWGTPIKMNRLGNFVKYIEETQYT